MRRSSKEPANRASERGHHNANKISTNPKTSIKESQRVHSQRAEKTSERTKRIYAVREYEHHFSPSPH
ncbi:hypothetical protein GYMLUDRAFT_378873 [Collybiopsis luxurians FD-317 M1]|nr:hypothetical protein GYMLUDRAFT_378873 [Collybiopsis luxurians FD-317 M1]